MTRNWLRLRPSISDVGAAYSYDLDDGELGAALRWAELLRAEPHQGGPGVEITLTARQVAPAGQRVPATDSYWKTAAVVPLQAGFGLVVDADAWTQLSAAAPLFDEFIARRVRKDRRLLVLPRRSLCVSTLSQHVVSARGSVAVVPPEVLTAPHNGGALPGWFAMSSLLWDAMYVSADFVGAVQSQGLRGLEGAVTPRRFVEGSACLHQPSA